MRRELEQGGRGDRYGARTKMQALWVAVGHRLDTLGRANLTMTLIQGRTHRYFLRIEPKLQKSKAEPCQGVWNLAATDQRGEPTGGKLNSSK